MFTFNIKIDGENVSPETVPLEDLLATLSTMRDAIVATAVDSGHARKSVFLSLTGITKKCNLLTLVENEPARDGTARVMKAIRYRDMSLVPASARKAISRLYRKAGSKSWTIAVQNGEPEAVIDPKQGTPVERYLRGTTSLFVKVIRVGGEVPRVLVQFPNNERRTFSVVDMEVTKELGGKLYEHLVLHGDAKWMRGSRKLADFKVKRVGRYSSKTANPEQAIKGLSKIMGSRWDDINPDQYLLDERNGD